MEAGCHKINIFNQIYMEILIAFLSSILGVIIALIVERERFPKIEIIASEDSNADNTYQEGPHKGERWKFFRVAVGNKKIPSILNWLMVRQTAENCRANIYMRGINNNVDLSFKGRWASTPELAHLNINDAILKLIYPDPVTIIGGDKEYLDIITKFGNDKEAYGWNNESYFHNWKNQAYELERGKYKVKVVVNTQNGISSSKEFMLNVSDKIENTSLN